MDISRERKRLPTKLYQQDIVHHVVRPRSYGIVLRCWHDPEEVPQNASFTDPLMRPLQHGEVGVSFISDGGEREILPESDLKLVDRSFQPGDYCKRSVEDVCSGVVVAVKVKGRLEHAISGEQVEGWWTVDDVEDKPDAEIGDYVIFEDWIGQVIEVFDESIVELSTKQLVRLPELGSRLNVGEKGNDILPPPASGMQSYLSYFGGQSQGSSDTVIAVKHSVYAVAWLAVNQKLDVSLAEKKKRPQRFWSGQDIGKLTLIRGRSDFEMRVGDRVHLKNATGLPSTQHGREGESAGIVHVQAFLVVETETSLDVLWQDGVHETLKSTDVIPYLNPDEYDCWPGDHVVWKSEEEKRSAIVQSVNAKERTALVLFPDSGATELISVLELDPHGTSDLGADPQSASEGFGVRRGDFVLIHHQETTNGLEKPRVPRIGELEAWVREGPFADGHFMGWRKEMYDIGTEIASKRSSGALVEDPIQRPADDDAFSWIGEVTSLNLDGTVMVTHPNFSVSLYPLERLTRLYDGIEQLEDDIWDDASDDHGSCEDDEVWAMDFEDGRWKSKRGDANESEEIEEELNEEEAEDSDGMHLDNESATSAHSGINSSKGLEVAPLQLAGDVGSHESEELTWKRFDLLPTAPPDHAFLSSPPAQPSKSFSSRLIREYRVLASSLPDSIIVRAYEDRSDLLRCLIIGPENTPYEDAPFVIDWMLDSNFPHSPPIAHFLSWTNGNGRVNPNLYEEGKVCLSILGTWAGDRNEVWNSARSSLLQTFVSIQGLVLVKEPWFCEPAYDKLRGTEEGSVNSRLYSEKAYVLSRGFVRRALEIPLGGLEEEINWLYYNKGRLEKVLRDARRLIENSKTDPDISAEDKDMAVPRLSSGGIITLERTLHKLQSIADSQPSN